MVRLPFEPVRSLKLGCSGQTPESMMPMMTPSPALPVPPARSQRPPGASSPRNVGVVLVSAWTTASWSTESTPLTCAMASAWAGVSAAAKPLNV